jgi:transcriptional regulator with XRE-family HTH domain
MHLNHLSSIERGERNAGIRSILKIARGLDMPFTALFEEFQPSKVRRLRL